MADGDTGYTPEKLQRLLADAIIHRSPIEDIMVVLKAGADPGGAVKNGLTPLHYATYENYIECMQLLLCNGACVNTPDDTGFTPLHLAAKHGLVQAVDTLLKFGAIGNFHDLEGHALSRALGDLTMEPLSLAVENNNPEVVELLLQNGVSPNNKYFLGSEINISPLEHTKCIELLLEYGADPNSYSRGGLTPLMKACKQEQEDIIKTLLKYNADVNATPPVKYDQKTALYFAAMNGNVKITKLLLDADASITRPEGCELSPLEIAVTRGNVGICELLIQYGYDVNELNVEMSSPLQLACWLQPMRNRISITKLLLDHGALPNYHCDRFSYSGPSLCPIVEYFSNQDDVDIDMVYLLVKYGATVKICRCRKYSKLLDANGLLEQLIKVSTQDEIMTLLLSAAEFYNMSDIADAADLSDGQRNILMREAAVPRTLRQSCRTLIRRCCRLPLPRTVRELPLPTILQSYVLFE